MSARVVQLDADVHQKVLALLPWYVCAPPSVGDVEDMEERVRVEAHLAECPRCQAELAWERKLQAAHAHVDRPSDADHGFALLRQRIAGAAALRRRGGLAARLLRGWRAGPLWMRWALLGQFAAVAALSVLTLVSLAPAEHFRALGRPAAAPATDGRRNLIVRFRPAATEEEIRHVLRDSDARLVDGPTTTDAYLLTVPAGDEKAAVARLRERGVVVWVEALDGRGGP